MPRRRSDKSRITRQATKLRQRRRNRTAEERLADNERAKLAVAKRRAEEQDEKRAERLKMLRIQSKKKRAALRSQRRSDKVNHIINKIENPDQNDEAIEKPDINCILSSCELAPTGKMDNAHESGTGIKAEETSPYIGDASEKVKLPESEEPVDPFKILSNWINDH